MYDEKEKKVVEVTPEKFHFKKGKIGNHINMRKTWSGTTKIEFSESTVEKSIEKMRKK